jgi:hypothetical protein
LHFGHKKVYSMLDTPKSALLRELPTAEGGVPEGRTRKGGKPGVDGAATIANKLRPPPPPPPQTLPARLPATLMTNALRPGAAARLAPAPAATATGTAKGS